MSSKSLQVVDGLSYLEQNSLEHSQLNCSNILIDCFGNVKLCLCARGPYFFSTDNQPGGQEHIRESTGSCPHAKAVGEIIMYLAHGQDREDGTVGLDDPQRFPLTFEFLSATQTASKVASIAQVSLLLLID